MRKINLIDSDSTFEVNISGSNWILHENEQSLTSYVNIFCNIAHTNLFSYNIVLIYSFLSFQLPPHLEERRRLRRIRNKDAAQKCRERRLAQTAELLQQIEQLESQTRYFEEVIARTREFKDQCEFVLNTHKNNCNLTRRRVVSGLSTLNSYNNAMQPCAVAHRRSSSSEGDINSPSAFIL